ncbi:MAG: hypothetical protein VX372_00480 [Verrucomicrobiota bacterium]|nr:hypothetical protein [Verrucomicrobiota bacterium]
MGSEIIFIIALIIVVALVYWVVLKSSAEKIAIQYQLLAERFGLELNQATVKMVGFIRSEPSVFGSYRGREMSISVPGKGLQNTRQIESVLKLELIDSQLSAQLAASGPLGGLRQRDSGGQARWKSGDERFDHAVDIRTDQGEAVAALLTEERRIWLTNTLKKSKATLYIGGGNLAYARLGLIANEATRKDFEAATEFLCDLAESVET